jgi:hypothetical protein
MGPPQKSSSERPNSIPRSRIRQPSSCVSNLRIHSCRVQTRNGCPHSLLDGEAPVFRPVQLSVALPPRVPTTSLPTTRHQNRTDSDAWFLPDSTLMAYHFTLVQQKPTTICQCHGSVWQCCPFAYPSNRFTSKTQRSKIGGNGQRDL